MIGQNEQFIGDAREAYAKLRIVIDHAGRHEAVQGILKNLRLAGATFADLDPTGEADDEEMKDRVMAAYTASRRREREAQEKGTNLKDGDAATNPLAWDVVFRGLGDKALTHA